MLIKSRTDADVSQKDIAKALGKSIRTIQNWEKYSTLTFLDLCRWFHVINRQMWPYLREGLYNLDNFEYDEIDEAYKNELIKYFKKSSSDEIRKICHLILGNYGSNWISILEMLFLHISSPLYQRVISARTVLIGYELDLNDGRINQKENIAPDIKNLTRCIEEGTKAVKKGLTKYN